MVTLVIKLQGFLVSNYSKNIGSSFLVNALGLFVSFISSIFVARSLGPEGKGFVVFILMIYSLIASHGHLGVLNAVSYFLRRDPKKRTEEQIFFSNIIYVVFLTIGYTFLLLFLYEKGYILNEYSQVFIYLGFIYILFSFFYTLSYHFYVGRDKVYIVNNFLLLERLAYLIIVLALFFTGRLNVLTYFVATVILLVLRVAGILWSSRLKIQLKFNKELIIDQFKYGKYIYLSALFIFLNYRVDQFMINYFKNKAELGIYSVGVQLAELAFLIPASITAPLLGNLLNIKTTEKDKRRAKTSITIKYTFYTTTAVCLLGIAMSPLVTILYGQSFARSAPILIILLIGIMFTSIGKIAPSFYHSIGKTKQPLIIAIMVATINISMNLLLIPKFGIVGAAIASTFSYIFYGTSYLWLLSKKEGFLLGEMLLLKKNDFNHILSIIKRNGAKIGSIIIKK